MECLLQNKAKQKTMQQNRVRKVRYFVNVK